MILPPALNTDDRRVHDLNSLRVYYIICEEMGITEEESIQKSFAFLMEWAGEYKFLEEFVIFEEYVNKRKKEIEKK